MLKEFSKVKPLKRAIVLYIFIGECREDKKMYGKMRYWHKNGHIYEGGWEASKMNGKGTFWFNNGNIYEGKK